MTNTNAVRFETGLIKLKAVLALIDAGTYTVDEVNGTISKGDKVIKGSIGSEDKLRWYNLSGVSTQAHRLLYAYYFGIDTLSADKIIKHFNGDILDNSKGNLVSLKRVGWKAELEAMQGGEGLMEIPPVEELEVAVPLPTLIDPPNTVKIYTVDELIARDVILELNKGKTNKEVAEKFGIKASKVNDIKRGKSSGKATLDLRAE